MERNRGICAIVAIILGGAEKAWAGGGERNRSPTPNTHSRNTSKEKKKKEDGYKQTDGEAMGIGPAASHKAAQRGQQEA